MTKLPTSWPFPSQVIDTGAALDAVNDQRAAVASVTVPRGKSKGQKNCRRRPPLTDLTDIPAAPY